MIVFVDFMNVSIGVFRNMVVEGKLIIDVIVNGLFFQGDKIGQEFVKIIVMISQFFEIVNNNIMKFFGENVIVKIGVKIFSDLVIIFSENLDVFSVILIIVVGVMGV